MINSRLIEVEGEKRKGFFSCWNENAKNILERWCRVLRHYPSIFFILFYIWNQHRQVLVTKIIINCFVHIMFFMFDFGSRAFRPAPFFGFSPVFLFWAGFWAFSMVLRLFHYTYGREFDSHSLFHEFEIKGKLIHLLIVGCWARIQ